MSRHQNSPPMIFGLKYKILILLIVLSMLGLGSFLGLSLSHFISDKRIYLLESATQITSAEADNLHKELNKTIEYIQLLVDQYDPQELAFTPAAQAIFERQKSIIKIQLVEFQGAARRAGFLLNKTAESMELERLPFNQVTEVNRPFFICNTSDPTRIFAITRISKDKYQFVVADTKVSSITNLMERKNFQFALVCPDYQPHYLSLSQNTPTLGWEQVRAEFLASSPYTKEIKNQDKDYFLSSSGISGTSLQLLNFVDSQKAMAVIKRLQLQAFFVFLTIFGLVSIIALILSTKVTAALESLTLATQKIADGDFNISLKSQGNDEVSILSKSFIRMKDKVLELLEKTKHTARMEAELETANLVQSTLFPDKNFNTTAAILSGDYRTASECGGDMWDYFETPEYIFLFIGDVVGHGVPSALMTTAARSVTAILRMQNESSPAKILSMLNHSIYETSKGKMWMTFFVGRFDKKTNELLYASASHNPPFLFPNKENVKKSDVAILGDSMGPSLGRESSATYSEASLKIESGDLLLFYTDGLTECENDNKELIGESRLVRQLVKQWNSEKDIRIFVQSIYDIIEKHRGQTPLADDVTYFAFQRNNETTL